MPDAKRVDHRMALILGIALLGLGLLVGLGSWHAYRLNADIKAHGVHVEGHVLTKSQKVERTGSRTDSETKVNYVVAYWFNSPSGQRIEASSSVYRTFFDTLQEGGPILIGYPAGDTSKNFPLDGGEASAGITLFMVAMALLFALIGGFLVRNALRPDPPAPTP
jgi:hypothetical protein